MIGERIKELRKKRGYSINELARMADVSKSYLSQIERGLQINPSLQLLKKIAVPLDTSIEYILGTISQATLIELDDEWKVLIKQAIEDGLKAEDFKEYVNYLKFQTWMKDHRNS